MGSLVDYRRNGVRKPQYVVQFHGAMVMKSFIHLAVMFSVMADL